MDKWVDLERAIRVYDEFEQRRAAGESVSVDSLLAEHADLRELLEPLLGPDDAPDESISRFQIRGELGRGGMGVVYRAYDPTLDRETALKVIHREHCASPRAVQRFLREAKITSRLNHPRICTVYEPGFAGDRVFLSMQLVEGETLTQRLSLAASGAERLFEPWLDAAASAAAESKVPDRVELPRLVEFFATVAETLHYAHQSGVVHRDVKPANLMIDRVGEPVLLDFGVAKIHQTATLTRTGTQPGTAGYAAPEQLAGEPSDARNDVWSLGIVMIEALGLEHPFAEGDSRGMAEKVRTLAATRDLRSRNGQVSEGLVALLERATVRSARDRISMDEFAAGLRRSVPKPGATEVVPALNAVSPSDVTLMPETAPDARLEFRGDDGRIVELRQEKSTLTIGRGEQSDVRIQDPRCSREQCEVRWTADGPELAPRSTRVPTLLNGRSLPGPVLLSDGDEIQLGKTVCVFRGETLSRRSQRESADSRIEFRAGTVLGRDPVVADVMLDHPTVSAGHARLEQVGGRPAVRDLGSTNGTFVDGRRIDVATLEAGAALTIGPFVLSFDGTGFERAGVSDGQPLVAQRLTREVRDHATGKPKRILDDVSLVIEPGEFVCLLGPSGSGKTTLLNALSARVPATSGVVSLGSFDLYEAFEALKQDIALVPQHELLHASLRVRKALEFTARLRLPPDTDDEQLNQAVDAALESVELTHVADNRIRDLSGGQRKRASLACEVISQPSLLFLDEVTSGLDEATDREVMQLVRRMADSGVTVVCVTHSLANVAESCHKVAVMAPPGVIAFYGTPADTLRYFDIQQIGDVYQCLKEEKTETWRQRFRDSAEYRRNVESAFARQSARRDADAEVEPPSAPSFRFGDVLRQFRILTHRYALISSSDARSLLMAFGQSLVIGSVLAVIWSNLTDTRYESTLVFFLGVSCFWFGCNNASKEIIKERDIYLRERDVNLSIVSYVFSKLFVLTALVIAQVGLLYGVVTLFEGIPGQGATQFLQMCMAGLAGTTMGLLISAAARTADQATTIVPIVLIPQILLSGAIVPYGSLGETSELLSTIAEITISGYWIYEGMMSVEGVRWDPPDALATGFILLASHALIYFCCAGIVLARRDSRTGGAGLWSWLLRRG